MLKLITIISFFLLVLLALVPYFAVIFCVLQIGDEMDDATSKKERIKGYFYILILVVGMIVHSWLIYF